MDMYEKRLRDVEERLNIVEHARHVPPPIPTLCDCFTSSSNPGGFDLYTYFAGAVVGGIVVCYLMRNRHAGDAP